MKKLNIFILLFITSYLFFLSSTFALETDTHENINGFIIENNLYDFSLDFYLQKQLGITNGISEEFSSDETKTVLEWIKKGGKYEDKPTDGTIPYLRSTNHFHDPLSNKGFSGLLFGLLFNGDSSIQWSQKPIVTQYPGGYYSWFDTRDYFYKALTSITKSDRDKYFAETFRGLGQLMHLVQDISVPAHSRDQFHVGYDYEGFILNYQNEVLEEYAGKFESLLENPISFDQSLLTSTSTLAPIPFANIFDSEKYTAANPDYLITLSNNIGLSEYANANFFSDRTIFLGYPHPAKENTDALLIEQIAEDGETDKLYYIQGYQSERLALYSYFANLDISGNPEGWKYTLDDAVHEDYAQKLIPRAVGYSAGLVNYFFRGEIEALNSTPINDSVGNITGMKMKVKNNTPDEAMSSTEQGKQGKLVVAYQYKDLSGNELYGLSGEVLVNEVIDSGEESAVEYDFVFANPIPLDAQEIKYWLVYRGKLGSEEDAAVGRMFETKFYGYLIDLGDPEAPINIIAKRNHYTLERYGNYISEPYSWPMKIGTTATLDNKYFYRSLKKDDGSVVILKSSIIDMTNEEEIFFAWPTPIFEEAPNGVHSFTTDGEFFYFTYYFTDIDYITFYKLLKYSKAGGDIIAELDWPHIRDNSSFEIKCDDSYLYIIRDLFSLSPRQFIIEVRNKSDFNLVTTIQLDPLGHDYFYRLFVDKNLIYVNYTDFSYPYGFHHLRSYSKDKWKLVESRFLEFLQYGRINTHDDKFFYAHNEFIYPDPYWSTEDQYIRIDKQTFEISVKNLGPGLFTSSWFNGLLSSYEYFIAEGLDKKGYKFEYGTEE